MNRYDPLPGKTARGARTAGLAAAAAGVQGVFLYRALFEAPTTGSWILWAVVFVVLCAAMTFNIVRDRRLDRAEAAERDAQLSSAARAREGVTR